MQITAPMRFEFFRDPDFTILAIDENDIFLKHERIFPRCDPVLTGKPSTANESDSPFNWRTTIPFMATSWPLVLRRCQQ
jgi:hypothetical protein